MAALGRAILRQSQGQGPRVKQRLLKLTVFRAQAAETSAATALTTWREWAHHGNIFLVCTCGLWVPQTQQLQQWPDTALSRVRGSITACERHLRVTLPLVRPAPLFIVRACVLTPHTCYTRPFFLPSLQHYNHSNESRSNLPKHSTAPNHAVSCLTDVVGVWEYLGTAAAGCCPPPSAHAHHRSSCVCPASCTCCNNARSSCAAAAAGEAAAAAGSPAALPVGEGPGCVSYGRG